MVATILLLLLGIAASWQATMPMPGANGSQMATVACKCCDTQRIACRAACCAKPDNNPVPSAPQSLPTSSLNQLTWLPASGSALWIVPASSKSEQPIPSLLVIAAGPVPLFQRNCSFLI